MNQVGVTVASLARRERAAAVERLLAAVEHNLAALDRQVRWVAARPRGERLLRIISSLLPAYTHPATRAFYGEPAMRGLVEAGLARCGALAREAGVRLSMHPGQFCVLATTSERALANSIDEVEYHVDVMRWLGLAGGWHKAGAHVNVHAGARGAGIEAFRGSLARLSAEARGLLTVENDETSFGLDDLLPLADELPLVVDLHHHWIASGGEYLEPDDPRLDRVRRSWRGVRPVAHVSQPRPALLPRWPSDRLPDFAAYLAAGVPARELRAHAPRFWNGALNRQALRHLAWADLEIEAKGKNLAVADLVAELAAA